MKHEEKEINTTYMRTTDPSTTPNPIGGEHNKEEGKCNNFKLRNNEEKNENPKNEITHITLSCTAGDKGQSLNNFINKSVGTHYLIDTDSTTYQLVNKEYAAYSVGEGDITGKLNPNNNVPVNALNNYTISIHLVNDGKSPFEKEQIDATVYLLEDIVERNDINPKFVIACSDYAPRNLSPGPYFPWKNLANAQELYGTQYNFGVYSSQEKKENPEIIIDKDHHETADVLKIQHELETYGIKVFKEDKSNAGEWDLQTQQGVLAFNLHHKGEEIITNPEKLKAWQTLGDDSTNQTARDTLAVWDENNDYIIHDLIKQFGDVNAIGELTD